MIRAQLVIPQATVTPPHQLLWELTAMRCATRPSAAGTARALAKVVALIETQQYRFTAPFASSSSAADRTADGGHENLPVGGH